VKVGQVSQIMNLKTKQLNKSIKYTEKMNLKIFTGAQKSQEWHEIRLGKFTASGISPLCAAKGIGAGGLTYINKKVAEALTGSFERVKETDAMRHGIYYEPLVRAAYSEITGIAFQEVGFVENVKYNNCGCSPDGVNFELKQGIEIKCPDSDHIHVEHLQIKNQEQLKKVCPEYYWQIMTCMMVTELPQWKFISFSPYFLRNKDLRLWVIDVFWNDIDINLLASRIAEANEIYNKIISEL